MNQPAIREKLAEKWKKWTKIVRILQICCDDDRRELSSGNVRPWRRGPEQKEFSCFSWKPYAILHTELQPVCTATDPAVFYVKETAQHVLFDNALQSHHWAPENAL